MLPEQETNEGAARLRLNLRVVALVAAGVAVACVLAAEFVQYRARRSRESRLFDDFQPRLEDSRTAPNPWFVGYSALFKILQRFWRPAGGEPDLRSIGQLTVLTVGDFLEQIQILPEDAAKQRLEALQNELETGGVLLPGSHFPADGWAQPERSFLDFYGDLRGRRPGTILWAAIQNLATENDPTLGAVVASGALDLNLEELGISRSADLRSRVAATLRREFPSEFTPPNSPDWMGALSRHHTTLHDLVREAFQQ